MYLAQQLSDSVPPTTLIASAFTQSIIKYLKFNEAPYKLMRAVMGNKE